MTKHKYAPLGSVSSGTMRPEDLIPDFAYLLGQLDRAAADKLEAAYPEVFGEVEQIEDDDLAEQQDYCLEELFDRLNDYAPPFAYFGAHEGDGADYGFWLSHDAIEDSIADGEIVKVNAGDEWPSLDDDCEYVLEVNDHGNMSLFARGNAHEAIWEIV